MPISTPAKPFHTITIDIVTSLPEVQNCNAMLAITDKFSKWITAVPGRHDFTVEEWAESFLNTITDWGIPATIISDYDLC